MKMQTKKGVTSRTNFDLGSTHLTTMDFGSIQPSYIAEVIPSDTFHVSMRSFARLAPLAVPVFGSMSCFTRAFFVPMRSIWIGFEDFMDRSTDASLSGSIPVITNYDIVYWLTQRSELTYIVEQGTRDTAPNIEKYDFSVNKQDYTWYHYNFTSRGRWIYKILLSLGYSINFSAVLDDYSSPETDNTPFSALPLLAFIRIFYDYIFPSQYRSGLGIGSLFESRTIQPIDVLTALRKVLCAPYSQDYFTAAWKDINRVGESDNVTISLNGGTSPSTAQSQPVSSNENNAHIDTSGNFLTSMGLRVLRAVSDYVVRNNIAGSRYFEQLAARFGVNTPHATPNRSIFIRSFKDDISIQDVTATATTEGSVLGEQGAKGIQSSNGKNSFTLSSDTYGYIICLSHVMPDTGYYQGRKRHTMHLDVLDFFTPEFESIGLQPIRNDELWADAKSNGEFYFGQSYGAKPNGVLGFSPRYSEYKKPDDYLTGDYRVPSVNTGLEAYHMFRDIPVPSIGHPMALNNDFLLCKQHEFDKIFQQITMPVGNWSFEPASLFTSNSSYQNASVLSFNGKAILFLKDSDYFCIFKFDGKDAFCVQYSAGAVPTTSLPLLYGVYQGRFTDVSVFSNVIPLTISTVTHDAVSISIALSFSPHVSLSIEGTKTASGAVYRCTEVISSGTYIRPVFKNSDEYAPIPSNLLLAFQDYFDHFYSIFRYDVTASRPMKSISDSMPIEEGGAYESLDYEGFNFGV